VIHAPGEEPPLWSPAHLGIQYAAIAGGRVIAVDIHDEKLDLAHGLGAEFTVEAANEERQRGDGRRQAGRVAARIVSGPDPKGEISS
jgi:propanol-preferring alcohol dehydrogenase